jgi:phosphoglycolate phosphatase-like HAD superfamily hydrolase
MWPGLAVSPGTILGVDCDGVLASDRLLWHVMRKRYPASIPAHYEDLRVYEWPRATDATTALLLRLSADPAFAGRLAPIPYMAEAMRRLHASGYRIHVITVRPEAVRGATRRWLTRQGVSDCIETIHCVPSGPDKVGLARALGCAAFVEDNHATAEAIGAAGIRSYLLDAPYNPVPTTHAIRVTDWQELLTDLVEAVPAGTPIAEAHAAQVTAASLAS